MPHKHKRRERDDSHFDLPPSVIAKALPVRSQQPKPKPGKKHGKKPQPAQQAKGKPQAGPAVSRPKNALEDDTPKAFQRLMQYKTTGRRARSGLDTGEKKQENKKRKREEADAQNDSSKKPAQAKPQQTQSTDDKEAKKVMPKIMPGEKLGDFAARVDRELPLSAMKKSNTPGAKGDHKMTKHEKHLRRLQQGWREEDVKIKEREQAEREEREAEMEEQLEILKEWEAEARGGKAKKKGTVPKKKKKSDGAEDSGDDDPDPWAKLKKRDKERQANPFDFAQAPPQLTKPREIFKIRGGAKVDVANVPNSVGSLRRREELATERRNIVEEYRRLMAAKRQ
ncbi:uncharacterized protein N7482_006714 [Penicillium canariense]|uniref:Urease accessory protein UreD n=1 Tax=Penicillium canariense TaxID=189055 RepID=A0A9W9LJ77_9EURO|nr:uncharacterized protein N7482_006714 [Penicillium canariense]KAJ5159710.1 hypothetical protein N7482_006714 [Penicillium canariense]